MRPNPEETVDLVKFTEEILNGKPMKFSITDFFSKFDQIRSFLWIWSHLLKKSCCFIFCAVPAILSSVSKVAGILKLLRLLLYILNKF